MSIEVGIVYEVLILFSRDIFGNFVISNDVVFRHKYNNSIFIRYIIAAIQYMNHCQKGVEHNHPLYCTSNFQNDHPYL